MDFFHFNDRTFLSESEKLKAELQILRQANQDHDSRLDAVQQKLNDLSERLNITVPGTTTQEQVKTEYQNVLVDFNLWLQHELPLEGNSQDACFYITYLDLAVSILIGGLASLLDFALVKIPKNTVYLGKFEDLGKMEQSGSPLTEWFRTLGQDQDGRASAWVNYLEKQFKVPYDKSVNKGMEAIEGFGPKTHRMQSLAHDPLMGLVFAILDIKFGNLTAIDKSGNLAIRHIADGAALEEVLKAPITWFGHLLSDITTKMGIPIPGWASLQVLQFGSFGEKERTVSDIARYMYLNGYDLRHLLTMSIVPLVIELLVRLYFLLINAPAQNDLISEREYTKLKNDIKLHRLLMISYSIATAGNVAKIASYTGNPLALNVATWIGFVKEAIAQAKIAMRTTKDYEPAIENRHTIDKNWDYLLKLRELNKL